MRLLQAWCFWNGLLPSWLPLSRQNTSNFSIKFQDWTYAAKCSLSHIRPAIGRYRALESFGK